jgi:hypothetical protein
MIDYDYRLVGDIIDDMSQCYICKAYTETERTIWGMRTCISADCSPRLSRNHCRECGNNDHVSIDGLCFYCFNCPR